MRKPNPTNITDINAALAENRQSGAMHRLPLSAFVTDSEQIRQGLLVGTHDIKQAAKNTPDDRLSSEAKARQLKDIIQLAYTIAKHGVLEPLIVYAMPGKSYGIICGERRYLAALYAAKRLGFVALIDAKVYPKKPTQSAIADIQFIENHHRQPLKLQDVIKWILRRFQQFEESENRPISAIDIQKIMAVKKSQAYQYKTIYNANREKVTALLQAIKPPTSLQNFADQAQEKPEHKPDEPATITDQRQEPEEKPAPKTIKITLPPDIRQRFIDACEKQNINPYDVLKNYIAHYGNQAKLF